MGSMILLTRGMVFRALAFTVFAFLCLVILPDYRYLHRMAFGRYEFTGFLDLR